MSGSGEKTREADHRHASLDRFLLIMLLAAFAVAQPLFDLLGRQAEFLVAQGLSPAGLAVFAVTLAILAPAAIAVMPLLLARIHRLAGTASFHLLFFLFGSLIAVQGLKALPVNGVATLSIAAALALTVIAVYRRFAGMRTFFRYLSPAVLVFPVAFLFFSRATPLLLHGGEAGPGGRVTIGAKHDVVFLVLDEFPLVSLLTGDLEIDSKRYPNFARLAEISTWYRSAATVSETTVGAVPSLLSGLYPDPGREDLPIVANFPQNLFTLLQDEYRIRAGETATRLCPGDLCTADPGGAPAGERRPTLLTDLALVYLHLVTPESWSERLPSITNAWTGFAGGNAPTDGAGAGELEEARALAELSGNVGWATRATEVGQFTASIEAGETPRLFYLHTLLPHAIWRYLPDGRQYLLKEDWEAVRRNTGPGITDVWHDDDWAVHQQWQRHLLQVRYVDTLLGRLLDHMEREGLLGRTLLVVAGDHGASFIPGQPRRSITETTLSDIASIPLFIHLPGQDEGFTDDRPATLADVLPTIVDALDVTSGWTFDGVSLLGEPPAESATRVAMKNGEVFEFRSAKLKAHLAVRAGEQQRVFGRGPRALFAIGPWGELLGTEPAVWPNGTGPRGEVELAGELLLRSVRLESPFVPRQVKGVISGVPDGSLPLDLAIAVNGTIRATTRTYEMEPYRRTFSALLPEGSLSEGRNTVRVFAVDGTGAMPVLSELTTTGETAAWSLETANGVARLSRADAAGLIAEPSGGRFSVRSAQDETGALVTLAGAEKSHGPGDWKALAFLDGQFAGEAMLAGGAYTIQVAPGATERLSLIEARVFLVDEAAGVALEAGYPAACSPQWLFAPPLAWRETDCEARAMTPLAATDFGYAATLSLNEASTGQYLAAGWGALDGGISWTTGKSAGIRIPLPHGLRRLVLKATVKPFLHPPELERQRLWITANGIPAGSWILEENRFTEIELAVPAPVFRSEPGQLVLELFLPDAVPPRSIGAGTDLRALGVALQRMDITAR